MYNEFQPKYDCRNQIAVVVDRAADGRPENGCLMWTMANGEAEWEPDKLKRIRSLLPHIRQAVRVRQELVAAEAHTYASVSELLEQTPVGAIFLDRRGAIASANRTALRMLRIKDGIHEWRGALQASSPLDDARFRRLVARALPRLGHVAVGGYMSARRSAGLPLIVHVHPITPARADLGAERLAALVLVRDPDARQLHPEMVSDVLGLTAAESRVAVRLAKGIRVRDIARELGRSENTVRWTLKRVLSKTNSARQADLVRLLIQLPLSDRDA